MFARLSKMIILMFSFVLFSANALAAPGDLDITFGGGDGWVSTGSRPSGNSDDVYSSTMQADGKLVLVGSSFNGSNRDIALVRYNNDGSLDASFNGIGKLTTAVGSGQDVGTSVIQQIDGKLVVTGFSVASGCCNNDIVLVRYNSDGTLDTGFNGSGIITTPIGSSYENGTSVIQQSDGKLVVTGFTNPGGAATEDFVVVRYNSDGSLDATFNTTGKVTTPINGSDFAYSIIQQADGKLVAAGFSNSDIALVRYNNDGSLDLTFNGTGIVVTSIGAGSDAANSIIQQYDGKLVVAGFTQNGSFFDFAILRYNSDGSLDTTFNSTGKIITSIGAKDDYGNSVIQQTDGKLVVAGSSNNGTNNDFAVVRYKTDGSLDTTFGNGGKKVIALGASNEWAYSVVQQHDGKLVLSGAAQGMPTGTEFVAARIESGQHAKKSFDIDLDSDVLMRNPSTGVWQSFLMQNASVSSSAALPINTTSDYIYQTQLDANGDGTADVLTRRTSDGTWILSTIVNNVVTNTTTLAMLNDPTWQFQANGDFNGDGTDDILLRNTSTLYWYVFYLKNGAVDSGSFSVAIWNSANDMLQGVADFNNDGKADVLMRNTAGLWSVYDFSSGVTSGVPGLWMSNSWVFQGLMDFNKDGIKDILLRDTNAGDLYPGVWVAFTLNSSHAASSVYGLNNVYRNLSVISLANTGDYDGNGTDDLLLRNTSNGVYYMFTTNTPAEASPGLQTLRAAPALYATPWGVLK